MLSLGQPEASAPSSSSWRQRQGHTWVAPARDDDREYLDELGVSEVLERDSDVIEQVRERFPEGVDALLDLVSFAPDASVLKEGGRLASPLGAAGEGPGRANVMASEAAQNLERLSTSWIPVHSA